VLRLGRMLRRQFLQSNPRRPLCQLCEFATAQLAIAAKRASSTLCASSSTPKPFREIPRRAAPTSRSRWASTAPATARRAAPRPAPSPVPSLASWTEIRANLVKERNLFLAETEIPDEALTKAALKTCMTAADAITGTQQTDVAPKNAASTLLGLDESVRQPAQALRQGTASAASRLNEAIDEVSESAYSILQDPRVFITPQLLRQYVDIQARLGRPRSLPPALLLYASKPMPRGSGGSITYTPQNASKASNAVDPKITEVALDAAIEARDMDAAVAIIEATYATKAYRRARFTKKALFPVGVLAAVPFALYTAATKISLLQNTLDEGTATGIIFTGSLAYVGFTAAIGLFAVMTANDQVKRVSWQPGVPLTERWLREEERAALDKVACAFGFSEPARWGEEEGAEFQHLREFILRRGMILDAVELMEGMNG
jgi:hypothetical protein